MPPAESLFGGPVDYPGPWRAWRAEVRATPTPAGRSKAVRGRAVQWGRQDSPPPLAHGLLWLAPPLALVGDALLQGQEVVLVAVSGLEVAMRACTTSEKDSLPSASLSAAANRRSAPLPMRGTWPS